MSGDVLCIGEALIDVVIREGSTAVEHVGGSLLNVAAGVATQGHPAHICAWWGKDERGDRLARWATDSGVSIVPGTDSAEKTAVAYAMLDDQGRATYEFELEWVVPKLGDLSRFSHLHTGSIAATLEPGGTQVVDTVRRIKDHATVSYDPNIRPALMVEPAAVVGRVEEIVALADVVKASDEDVNWLYPDEPVEDVMRRWIAAGPSMVVLTRGPWGAYALLAGNRDMLHLDQMTVTVGDTVGAGDSFMAGLISGLLEAGFLGSLEARDRLREAGWSDVQPALHKAVITSGLTVSRNGAYAPTPEEVQSIIDADATFA